MKKSNKKRTIPKNIPSAEEIATRYGTYEIQATAESDNEFPAISHGLPNGKINNPKIRRPKQQ